MLFQCPVRRVLLTKKRALATVEAKFGDTWQTIYITTNRDKIKQLIASCVPCFDQTFNPHEKLIPVN